VLISARYREDIREISVGYPKVYHTDISCQALGGLQPHLRLSLIVGIAFSPLRLRGLIALLGVVKEIAKASFWKLMMLNGQGRALLGNSCSTDLRPTLQDAIGRLA
jgi:hypothetical protein